MTIHDDARAASDAAGRKVYDDALAQLRAQLGECAAIADDLRGRLDDAQADRERLAGDLASAKRTLAVALARIAELERPAPADPDALYRPVRFASVDEARAGLNAPQDANYVIWRDEWTHLEQAFAALKVDDILVLPERVDAFGQPIPYLIDSSRGFMASAIASVSGPDGTRTPVVSNGRLWFAMSRARRGILGLGPKVVIEPSASAWTAPAQPKPMYAYDAAGNQKQELVGAANKLIEAEHASPFFANFEIRGRDFGGVAYNGIVTSNRDTTIRRVFANGSWRGFAGIPNGETGAFGFLGKTYLLENCDLFSTGGPSPIMWNRTMGGTVRHLRSNRPSVGMWTFWKCGGVNVFEDVHLECDKIGLNLEEEIAGFELHWTRGSLHLADDKDGFHLNINPSGGSQIVRLVDVDVSLNGYTDGALSAHVYRVFDKQRRADVTCDTAAVSYVPSNGWN